MPPAPPTSGSRGTPPVAAIAREAGYFDAVLRAKAAPNPTGARRRDLRRPPPPIFRRPHRAHPVESAGADPAPPLRYPGAEHRAHRRRHRPHRRIRRAGRHLAGRGPGRPGAFLPPGAAEPPQRGRGRRALPHGRRPARAVRSQPPGQLPVAALVFGHGGSHPLRRDAGPDDPQRVVRHVTVLVQRHGRARLVTFGAVDPRAPVVDGLARRAGYPGRGQRVLLGHA